MAPSAPASIRRVGSSLSDERRHRTAETATNSAAETTTRSKADEMWRDLPPPSDPQPPQSGLAPKGPERPATGPDQTGPDPNGSKPNGPQPSHLRRDLPGANPDRLLAVLNEAQREAVSITKGPLAIVAGAGSGKTRVISHRAAYAIETGVVAADRVLLVTFTDKAATEMVQRMRALGHPRVMARTFHAFALAQLRHFWPSRHDGEPLPQLLDSKTEILFRLARGLPGHYRFAAPRDLAETIEWAKIRRIPPNRWEQDGHQDGGDRAPIPADLFARLYANYERTKDRAGRIDFEDMLLRTVDLLESDDDAAETVRGRKTWFSVDEYQDTNPLAERLLELWLGSSNDLAVVGDPDQTIYTFTGATPDYLLNFEARHPGARTVALLENYRSTPQVLELANRLTAGGSRGALRTANTAGPAPSIRRHADDATERRAIVEAIRTLLGEGLDPAEIAILVRINAQLPDFEQGLTGAGIPFRVRGQRFFQRSEVRDARQLLRRSPPDATGPDLVEATRRLFGERLGLVERAEASGTERNERGLGDRDRAGDAEPRTTNARPSDGAPDPVGDEARERTASLEFLVEIVRELAAADLTATIADVLAELDRRDAEEAAGGGGGVNLLTYHRAKGLEWDAVFLPALEEGLLPIRQAKDDAAIAEERRLLYVGITRARRHLTLSWAHRRIGSAGTEVQRKPSRFLAMLEPPRTTRAWRDGTSARSSWTGLDGAGSGVGSGAGNPRSGERRTIAGAIAAVQPPDGDGLDRHLLEALQLWRRERAARDGVPSYVVAHDAALFAIAEAEPRTLTALGQVKGMGPVKVERYGAEILALMARGDVPRP
jgi:DNA helicase-2/ATP-dependent DNA helicase PcrA